MNPNDQMLNAFAFFLIAMIGAAIVIPYLRGKTDLVSASNALLFGGLVFVGLSCFESASRPSHMGDYTSNTYLLFMVSATWFFAVYVAAYHWWKWPKRAGGRVFQKWPEPTWPVTLSVIALVVCLVGFRYVAYVPVLSQVLLQLTEKAGPFAVVVAFTAWYRDKANPIMAALVIAAVCAAMVIAVLLGGSRRTFLGVLVAIPVCYYWYHGRNKKPLTNVILAGGVALGIGFVLTAYSATRWFDVGRRAEERNLQTSIEQLSNTWNNLAEADFLGDLGKLGQNATEVSLYSIFRTSNHDPAPFESLYIAAVNPVPRSMWPDKPVVYGSRIVEEVTGGTQVNWGPGIVGHGFNEGGVMWALPMLTFYALLFALLMGLADGCLASQPNNPFLVGILTASIPHLIATLRGDMSVVFIQLGGGLALLILMQWITVPVFGATRRMPNTLVGWQQPTHYHR